MGKKPPAAAWARGAYDLCGASQTRERTNRDGRPVAKATPARLGIQNARLIRQILMENDNCFIRRLE